MKDNFVTLCADCTLRTTRQTLTICDLLAKAHRRDFPGHRTWTCHDDYAKDTALVDATNECIRAGDLNGVLDYVLTWKRHPDTEGTLRAWIVATPTTR